MRIIKVAVDWKSSDEYLRLNKAIRDVVESGKSLVDAAREHRVDVRMLASRVNEARKLGLPPRPKGEQPPEPSQPTPPPKPPTPGTGKGLAKDKPVERTPYGFRMPHEWEPRRDLTSEEIAELLAKMPKYPSLSDLPRFKAETTGDIKKEATFNLREWMKKKAAEDKSRKLGLSIVNETDAALTTKLLIGNREFDSLTWAKKDIPRDILRLPRHQMEGFLLDKIEKSLGRFATSPIEALEEAASDFAATVGSQAAEQVKSADLLSLLMAVFTELTRKMHPFIISVAMDLVSSFSPEEIHKAIISGIKRVEDAKELDRQISEPDSPRALARQRDAILDRHNRGEITQQQMETALKELT